MAWSRAFQKCIIYHFLNNFFLQTFLLYNWILQKKSIFANLQIFLQILKVEHKSFPMLHQLSYLDFKHGILTPPPQRILVFKYPSRDRVNVLWQNQKFIDTLSLLFRSIYLCIFILLSSWKGMVLLNGGLKTITFVRTVCL